MTLSGRLGGAYSSGICQAVTVTMGTDAAAMKLKVFGCGAIILADGTAYSVYAPLNCSFVQCEARSIRPFDRQRRPTSRLLARQRECWIAPRWVASESRQALRAVVVLRAAHVAAALEQQDPLAGAAMRQAGVPPSAPVAIMTTSRRLASRMVVTPRTRSEKCTGMSCHDGAWRRPRLPRP
jgi:hypothetical protein